VIERIIHSSRSFEICHIVFQDDELITQSEALIREPVLRQCVAEYRLIMLNKTFVSILISEKERRELAHVSDEVLFSTVRGILDTIFHVLCDTSITEFCTKRACPISSYKGTMTRITSSFYYIFHYTSLPTTDHPRQSTI